jgi:predicted PurR-regulated permease PerM
MSLAADANHRSQRQTGEVAIPEEYERDAMENWQLVAYVSITGMFALAILAGLYFMKDVVVPVILAWVVANILLPIVSRLEKLGLPRVATVIFVTLALVAVLLSIVTLMSLPLTYWLGRATELGALVKEKLQLMSQPLAFMSELLAAIGQATGQGSGAAIRVEENTNIVGGIVGILTPAVSQGILFLGALVFYLIYQKQIKSKAVLILPSRNARLTALKIFADVEKNTTVYFGTFTIVNVCLAILTAGLAYAVGLPNPMLWGVLAGVLNYIPYIGAAIMVIVLFVIGIFTFSVVSQALVAPIVYLGMTTLEGHFITPALMGRRMTLNPFAVFLAIGFWTWMWGPIGAFVAVPILMTLTVTFRHLFPAESPELPG